MLQLAFFSDNFFNIRFILVFFLSVDSRQKRSLGLIRRATHAVNAIPSVTFTVHKDNVTIEVVEDIQQTIVPVPISTATSKLTTAQSNSSNALHRTSSMPPLNQHTGLPITPLQATRSAEFLTTNTNENKNQETPNGQLDKTANPIFRESNQI
jgi:hypothetical protein